MTAIIRGNATAVTPTTATIEPVKLSPKVRNVYWRAVIGILIVTLFSMGAACLLHASIEQDTDTCVLPNKAID